MFIKIGRTPRLIVIHYALLLSFFFYSCPDNNKPSYQETLPSQIISDFKLFESSSGAKLYQVYAEKAYIYSTEQKIEVEHPYVIFYNEEGKINSTLSAIRGNVNTNNSNLLARDSVIVKTQDSTILYTDSLLWDNRNQIITTDAWVKIESKQGLIIGQGLVTDAALKKIEIKSDVSGKSIYEFK